MTCGFTIASSRWQNLMMCGLQTVPPQLGVLANDRDDDHDSLAATLVAEPSNGTVTLERADGSFAYTPAADFNGMDSFTYAVSDAHGGTDTAIVSIDVTPVNDPPELNVIGNKTVAELAP